MNAFQRWLRFNLVGLAGLAVQISALALFNRMLHGRYLWATVCALELTLLHNFLWHERVTWSDRSTARRWQRLLRFHLSNGVVSLLGNLALMRLLVQTFHMQVMLANLIAIVTCSFANFLLSHFWAFATETQTRRSKASAKLGLVASLIPLFLGSSLHAQEPTSQQPSPELTLPVAPQKTQLTSPQPTAYHPPRYPASISYFPRMGVLCGAGASSSSVDTKPASGCGAGFTWYPLPVFVEVGVMGPQANRSDVSGYVSADVDIPLSRLDRKYAPMALVGYTRMFETGHALDYGVAIAMPRWRKPSDPTDSMRIELRDYWTFANPSQHNVMLRVGWMIGGFD